MCKNYMLRFLLFSVFLFCFSSLELFSYNLKNISRREGLSNSSVLSLYQDMDGYLWIGTCDGVNIYDGNEVRVLQTDDSKKFFRGKIIESIIETERGLLWIQTNHGLVKFDKYTGTSEIFKQFTEKNFSCAYNNRLYTEVSH